MEFSMFILSVSVTLWFKKGLLIVIGYLCKRSTAEIVSLGNASERI